MREVKFYFTRKFLFKKVRTPFLIFFIPEATRSICLGKPQTNHIFLMAVQLREGGGSGLGLLIC